MFPKAFMRAEVAKILDFVLQVDDATLKRESPDAIRQCLEKVSSGIGADYPNLYVCVTHRGHPQVFTLVAPTVGSFGSRWLYGASILHRCNTACLALIRWPCWQSRSW